MGGNWQSGTILCPGWNGNPNPHPQSNHAQGQQNKQSHLIFFFIYLFPCRRKNIRINSLRYNNKLDLNYLRDSSWREFHFRTLTPLVSDNLIQLEGKWDEMNFISSSVDGSECVLVVMEDKCVGPGKMQTILKEASVYFDTLPTTTSSMHFLHFWIAKFQYKLQSIINSNVVSHTHLKWHPHNFTSE